MTGLIVHEWIEANGGAEKVVAGMVEAFPDAPVLALWDDAPGTLGAQRVLQSWLARTPLRRSKIAAVPWLPPTWRTVVPVDEPYDWLLVSSHLFAHHVRGRGLSAQAPKLIYAHTPARYLWVPDLDRRGASAAVRAAAAVLKPLDVRRAREATAVACNSAFVADRIARTWGRSAEVIYPPVDIETIASGADWAEHLDPSEAQLLARMPHGFVLGASRMVPYKRLERVIRAGELAGRPVVLAGGGPQEGRLRAVAAHASVPVHFAGRVSDALLYALYQWAAVFVFPPRGGLRDHAGGGDGRRGAGGLPRSGRGARVARCGRCRCSRRHRRRRGPRCGPAAGARRRSSGTPGGYGALLPGPVRGRHPGVCRAAYLRVRSGASAAALRGKAVRVVRVV